MSKNAFAAAAALSMMMAGSSAMAASSPPASTPFTVSVQINDGCTVNTSGAVSLSGLSGVQAKTMDTAQSNTGTVTATCTSGTKYSLKLTSTNNSAASDGKYYMKGTKAGNAATIPYMVKYTSISASGSATINADTAVLSGTPTGTAPTQSFASGGTDTITLTFTSGTPVGTLISDTYSDIVNVTAEF